jgi:hypothetical protein
MIGNFTGDFLCEGAVRSREAIATYVTKSASYSPGGGLPPVKVLETLLRGLHSRRLPVIRHVRTMRAQQHRAPVQRSPD